MNATCQRCGVQDLSWTVVQADFNIGSMQCWKVQLCRLCTQHVQCALSMALQLSSALPVPTPEPRAE